MLKFFSLFRFRPIKGFTLIELMVSVAILAIVSSIGFVTYSNAQKIARDGRRKQDLRSIAIGLALYKQQNGRYPCHEGTASTAAQPWIVDFLSNTYKNAICNNLGPAFDTNYINVLPVDPINNATYYYFYRGFDCVNNGQQYYIIALLENPNDPGRVGVSGQKNCNGVNMYPTYVSNPSSFVVIGE